VVSPGIDPVSARVGRVELDNLLEVVTKDEYKVLWEWMGFNDDRHKGMILRQ